MRMCQLVAVVVLLFAGVVRPLTGVFVVLGLYGNLRVFALRRQKQKLLVGICRSSFVKRHAHWVELILQYPSLLVICVTGLCVLRRRAGDNFGRASDKATAT